MFRFLFSLLKESVIKTNIIILFFKQQKIILKDDTLQYCTFNRCLRQIYRTTNKLYNNTYEERDNFKFCHFVISEKKTKKKLLGKTCTDHQKRASEVKGVVHPKIKILSLITLITVIN